MEKLFLVPSGPPVILEITPIIADKQGRFASTPLGLTRRLGMIDTTADPGLIRAVLSRWSKKSNEINSLETVNLYQFASNLAFRLRSQRAP